MCVMNQVLGAGIKPYPACVTAVCVEFNYARQTHYVITTPANQAHINPGQNASMTFSTTPAAVANACPRTVTPFAPTA